MSRTVVGVLRGGPSSEYEHSLKTGGEILSALSEEKYNARDILIDREGMWHARGFPVDPARALAQVDVAVNALHGGVGEDGTIARLLERSGVPYTGSRPHASSTAFNKLFARERLLERGIRMPRAVPFVVSERVSAEEMARKVFREFSPPYIAKPVNEGASHGIVYVPTILELPDAIADILNAYGAVIVEEYVVGEEAVVGVVEQFRGEEIYTLPPAAVLYPEKAWHIEPHHYDGHLKHTVPSHFTYTEKQILSQMARAAHQALELSHVSRADIILTKRGPYLLEVDTLPHLYEGSAMKSMLEAVGSSVVELVEHMIMLARKA